MAALSITHSLHKRILDLATEMNAEAGKGPADGNDVDVLVELVLKRALDLDPLMDAVDEDYIAGVNGPAGLCPLCGGEIDDGYVSYTLDDVVCYGCRFDGDNP